MVAGDLATEPHARAARGPRARCFSASVICVRLAGDELDAAGRAPRVAAAGVELVDLRLVLQGEHEPLIAGTSNVPTPSMVTFGMLNPLAAIGGSVLAVRIIQNRCGRNKRIRPRQSAGAGFGMRSVTHSGRFQRECRLANDRAVAEADLDDRADAQLRAPRRKIGKVIAVAVEVECTGEFPGTRAIGRDRTNGMPSMNTLTVTFAPGPLLRSRTPAEQGRP